MFSSGDETDQMAHNHIKQIVAFFLLKIAGKPVLLLYRYFWSIREWLLIYKSNRQNYTCIFSPDIAWVSKLSYIVDCRLYTNNDTQQSKWISIYTEVKRRKIYISDISSSYRTLTGFNVLDFGKSWSAFNSSVDIILMTISRRIRLCVGDIVDNMENWQLTRYVGKVYKMFYLKFLWDKVAMFRKNQLSKVVCLFFWVFLEISNLSGTNGARLKWNLLNCSLGM